MNALQMSRNKQEACSAGLRPLVAPFIPFLGRCPGLVWKRAVGAEHRPASLENYAKIFAIQKTRREETHAISRKTRLNTPGRRPALRFCRVFFMGWNRFGIGITISA
jgi:hypothetical protein